MSYVFMAADYQRHGLNDRATGLEAIAYLRQAGARNVRALGIWQGSGESTIPLDYDVLDMPHASTFLVILYDAPGLVHVCPTCGNGHCNAGNRCVNCLAVAGV